MRKTGLVLAGAVVALVAVRASAVTFSVQGATMGPGESREICFDMTDSGGQVSGLQMDIGWQAGCLTPDMSGATEAACFVNPDTNRTTFKTKASGISMRVIMLNIADTTPIPANVSNLFCCSFRAADTAGGRTCAINLSNAIASNPTGQRIQPVVTNAGAVVVSGSQMGTGRRGGGTGAGMAPVVAPVVEGGAAPAAAGGGAAPAGGGAAPSGGSAPAAGAAAPAKPAAGAGGAAPAMPGAPGVPGFPAAPAIPALPTAAQAVQAAEQTVAAVLGTRTPPTAKTTPAKGTPTAKGTANATPKESPKPQGTPTPKKDEKKDADSKGTPTAKKPAAD